MEKPKIKAKRQGSVIVEFEDQDRIYILMFPDGQIEHANNKKEVERLAKKWSKDNIPPGYNVGLLEIDYR